MTFRLTHILALLSLIFAVTPLHAQQPPAITAKSALLLDANTGRVLYKKNEEERRPVASTQKLLTALIVAETGSLSKNVDISQGDGDCEPTKLYLKPGQSYSRSQLLTALLVKSANDVARVLARDNAGSVNRFAERMTQKMRELGGTSSNFVNPNGLPAQDQYSTARDMARVARAAYKNDTLREIMKTRSYDFRYSSGKVVPLRNTNRVLRTYSFCNGMKTGYTELAGHCLISSGSYKGKDVISVVLGATKARCAEESAALLAYGLDLTPAQMSALRLPGASE